MRWLENFTLVMRTSITSLRESVQDPERMLHQLVLDMEEELDRVRHSVAGAIADEIQLGKKVERSREEARQWMDRAAGALRRGDEATAQAALEQKVLAEERAQKLDAAHQQQKGETAKLHYAVRDLEDKINQARQKQTLLLARLARAESSTRIHRALDATESRSAFAQFSRLEHRVERAEALCEAHDRLSDRDPQAEELERQFQRDEQKARVVQELDALKRRVQENP